ncbi:hypothetical protein B0J13DRAFT_601978 [Dactylonectria estremocensis]|uniref:CorA-like transporter domain-containing protein n=1 Tax=Dactylonectria estremocensis TaxID=1079267 RepID=A0A9P9FKD6_9HYPO|nr:hypothetical protein B0J13DRAFT_601978 [Dactylonectria estremocensis]
MAPSSQLPPEFQVSYRNRDSYPRNYTHSSASTYPSALAEFAKRLDLAANDLFETDLKHLEVSFRDLKSDNGEGKDVDKRHIHSPEGLTKWLGIKETQSTDPANPQPIMSVERKDPKSRFIYIFGENTRARLRTTRSMLTEILTFHQVSPDYLDFLFIFGLQSDSLDLRFSSFREQTSLRPVCRALGINSLARSGRQYQLCYNLKGVTAKHRDWENPLKDEFSIRPAAFYHRFDVENGNALWMVTKGGTDIESRYKELTGKKARPQDKSFGSPDECFISSLSAHLLFCHWSTEDWREYIKWLEYVVDQETRMAVLGPTGSGHHHRIYTAGDIQRLLKLEEKVCEITIVLESNIEVMTSLKRFYERLVAKKDFDLKDCTYEVEDFTNQLSHMMDDFRLQIGRASALARMLSNRTELVKQHRLERLNRNLEKEAIVVRIVTIVTLIYLPATFVSTLFSTDIIKYQGSPEGTYSPVAMNRWLQVTLPLSFMTLGAAYLGNKWAESRSQPYTRIGLQDDHQTGGGNTEVQVQQNSGQRVTPLNQWWQWTKAGGCKAVSAAQNRGQELKKWAPRILAARVLQPPVSLLPLNNGPTR